MAQVFSPSFVRDTIQRSLSQVAVDLMRKINF